ncbi:hypothetical protein [Marispirochaeta aestuarii]|uniref:hypothetical protein n=1 Tax=Marispirochaeta aestuarii TaxID=1963862 RepID=UPI002ABD2893|nr:hypothetical protein [Marispirochaeta aestuarii]
MINRRYRYNGKPIIKLNPMQKRIKKQIDDKIISNEYKFEKISCPVCTGIDFELLYEKDRYGLYLPVVICKTCGLIQSNLHMNQMAYANFYNEEYRKLYVGEMNPTEAFFSSQYRKINYYLIEITPLFLKLDVALVGI